MELRHLRYFVSVAEIGSVSKAALRVHISQPALSRQIQDLEAELGVRLFDRVGRRIRLTAVGEDLLARSHNVLAQAGSLVERARALTSGVAGVLHVGATPQTMQSVLADFLPSFQRACPGVDVQLSEHGGVRLYELVEQGDLHLAVSGILPTRRLESRPLFPIHLLGVTRRKTRGKRRATIDVAELANEPLLLLSKEFGTRHLFDAACRLLHLQPHIVLESREPHSLIALAEAGQGIAIVPSTVRFVSTRAHAVPLVREGTPLGVWGGPAWDPRRTLPPHATHFVDELAMFASRMPRRSRVHAALPPLPPPHGT
jgi:LysR family cyn operon transcriptional activator